MSRQAWQGSHRFLAVGLLAALTAVAGAVLLVAGPVVGEVPEEVAAPEIEYGVARCANYPCRMVIKEPEHSAALSADDGQFAFCDIGCLLAYLKNNYPAGEKVKAAFVRDWPTGKWTEARTATFVRMEDVRTPMRYGLIAFADAHEAASYAQEKGGQVLSFKEATHYVMTERAKRMGGGSSPSH